MEFLVLLYIYRKISYVDLPFFFFSKLHIRYVHNCSFVELTVNCESFLRYNLYLCIQKIAKGFLRRMDALCHTYQLKEFERRQKLKTLRLSLQSSMPDKYKGLWWCKDVALTEIRAQFVESTNHCVIDGFLGSDAFSNVMNEVQLAKSAGNLDIDGVLTFKGREETIRTDKLGWFDCSAQPQGVQCYFTQSRGDGTGDDRREGQEEMDAGGWPHLHNLLQHIETLVSELGEPETVESTSAAAKAVFQTLSSSKTRSKVMVTCYDGRDDDSSRYTRHVDNGNKNGRTLTAIYYLNEKWRRSHGGALRIYARTRVEDGSLIEPDKDFFDDEVVDTASVHTAVEPIADRLVLFLSDWRTPHEVMPTHRDRFAVTVWFYDPIEKMAANAEARRAHPYPVSTSPPSGAACSSGIDSNDEPSSINVVASHNSATTVFTCTTDPDDLD